MFAQTMKAKRAPKDQITCIEQAIKGLPPNKNQEENGERLPTIVACLGSTESPKMERPVHVAMELTREIAPFPGNCDASICVYIYICIYKYILCN